MTELKEIAAILYRILSKPVTVQIWVIVLLGAVMMCGVGGLHGAAGWFAFGLFIAALVGVVMLSESKE